MASKNPRSVEERTARRLDKAQRRIKRWTGDPKKTTAVAKEYRVIQRLSSQ